MMLAQLGSVEACPSETQEARRHPGHDSRVQGAPSVVPISIAKEG